MLAVHEQHSTSRATWVMIHGPRIVAMTRQHAYCVALWNEGLWLQVSSFARLGSCFWSAHKLREDAVIRMVMKVDAMGLGL
jgi:hypothetical protein